jgi:hypothetical protein
LPLRKKAKRKTSRAYFSYRASKSVMQRPQRISPKAGKVSADRK